MAFNFSKVKPVNSPLGRPQSGTLAAPQARITYGPDRIKIAMTGAHNAPAQALQVLNEVYADDHINDTDHSVARRSIDNAARTGEWQDSHSVLGTHVSVDIVDNISEQP